MEDLEDVRWGMWVGGGLVCVGEVDEGMGCWGNVCGVKE